MSQRRHQLTARLRAAGALVVCLALAGASVAALGGRTADRAGTVVGATRAHLGDRYVWGATGPDRWDCSGLTSTMWRTAGLVTGIPRTAHEQQAWSVPIPREQLLPGDLVFLGRPATHVGLYSGGDRMLDASSSRGQVIERPLWPTESFTFGRVPRQGMPAVQPWSGSSPTPKPSPSPSPAPTPPTPPAPSPPAPVSLRDLPWTQHHPSSRTALAAATAARGQRGQTRWTDDGLVRAAWHHAGGHVLPVSRAALEARARPGRLTDARAGDIVVYGRPAVHFGYYVGHRRMVDASRVLGRVVVRPVFTSETVRLIRMPR